MEEKAAEKKLANDGTDADEVMGLADPEPVDLGALASGSAAWTGAAGFLKVFVGETSPADFPLFRSSRAVPLGE